MNSEKYLPIGTICLINGSNELVMITGYYSMEYHKQIKIYDYQGIVYPTGNLRNKFISFNHSDVLEVKHMGYINEDFNLLNTQLLNQSVSNVVKEDDSLFSNIEFDENGIVIFAEIKNEAENKKDIISLNNQDNIVENPFVSTIEVSKKDEVTEDDTSSWPIFNNIEFDENGVVVNATMLEKENKE